VSARAIVVLFGSQQIVADTLRGLLARGVHVAAVVMTTRPSDPPTVAQALRDAAGRRTIPVWDVTRVSPDLMAAIGALAPDAIVSTYCRAIFPPALLAIPRHGCVNVHPGRLPQYRGPMPTFWALVNGERTCGVTLHKMDAGTDTGPIIDQTIVPIGPRDTGHSLHAKAMRAGYRLLMAHIDAIVRGTARSRAQDPTAGSYFGPFTEQLRYVDWRKGSAAICRQVRALTRPYPGALAMTAAGPLVIWKMREAPRRYPVAVSPGTIRTIHRDGRVVVATSDGCVVLTEYEFPEIPAGMDAGAAMQQQKSLA
jgi:methionyl-tRNA formyltransferase